MTRTRRRGQRFGIWTLVLVLMVAIAPPPAEAGFNILGRIRALFGARTGVGVASGRRSGAAVRDPDLCPSVNIPLTAIVPDTTDPVLTSEAYPTFWFYVPYALKPTNGNGSIRPIAASTEPQYTLKFVLQDDQHRDVYQTRFTVSAATPPGIISLRVLAPNAALAVGKPYHWYFLVYCNDPEETYEPAFVTGLIQRQDLSDTLKRQLEQASPEERVNAYVDNRLWYDALATLDALRSTTPAVDVASGWSEILQGVDLDALNAKTLPDAAPKLSLQPIVGRFYIQTSDPQISQPSS